MSVSITSISPATFDDGRSVTLSGSGFGAAIGQVFIAGVEQIVNSWTDTGIVITTLRGASSIGACRVDVIPAAGSGEQVLFFDGFESGDLDSTNVDGFAWTDSNRISIVTMRDDVAGHEGTPWPVVIWNGAPTYTPQGVFKDWTARTGNNSMRFRFPASTQYSEQRFSLGTRYTDIWFRWAMRVPTNFDYPGSNNKLASFWSTTYDASYTLTLQLRPNVAVDGGAKLVYQDGGVAAGEVDVIDAFMPTSRAGDWMQLAVHVIWATGASANDGTIDIYRKWDGDPSWTQILNDTTADTYADSGSQGIGFGYLMGFNNGLYVEETDFLFDDFTLSESSLVV